MQLPIRPPTHSKLTPHRMQRNLDDARRRFKTLSLPFRARLFPSVFVSLSSFATLISFAPTLFVPKTLFEVFLALAFTWMRMTLLSLQTTTRMKTNRVFACGKSLLPKLILCLERGAWRRTQLLRTKRSQSALLLPTLESS